MPDALADVLVERDGVAEAAAARMRRGREEAVVCRMPPIHVGMRHTAENGEIVAMFLENFQIRRQWVIAPALLREELFGQQTKVVADAEEPARLAAGGRISGNTFRHGGKGRRHGIQHRQREQNTRSTEELAPRECGLGRNEWSDGG